MTSRLRKMNSGKSGYVLLEVVPGRWRADIIRPLAKVIFATEITEKKSISQGSLWTLWLSERHLCKRSIEVVLREEGIDVNLVQEPIHHFTNVFATTPVRMYVPKASRPLAREIVKTFFDRQEKTQE